VTRATVSTRPATDQDDAFLFALFKAVRSPEFAHALLPLAQLDLLLSIQYAGQKQTYGARYPDGNAVILLEGAPVGRIWLFRGTSEHRLVDISLMPEFRNRGFGVALVMEAIAAARAGGVPLRCSVAATNPGSLRFHQRLGFQIVGQDDLNYNLAVQP
jgi:ribosomal protein S18 acetylase RimI-like enzyme